MNVLQILIWVFGIIGLFGSVLTLFTLQGFGGGNAVELIGSFIHIILSPIAILFALFSFSKMVAIKPAIFLTSFVFIFYALATLNVFWEAVRLDLVTIPVLFAIPHLLYIIFYFRNKDEI